MRQTVVAMFDRYAAAKQAAQQLRDSGFGDSVFVTDEVGGANQLEKRTSDDDTGVFAHVRHFFSGLFGADDDQQASPYAEAIRRGGAIVKVEVDADADVERARAALEAAGAVDVDERASEWKATGWNEGTSLRTEQPSLAPSEPTAEPQRTSAPSGIASDASAASLAPDTRPAASDDDRDVIPVVKEELQVGKRAVRKGGVRVYAHTVETPVTQTVDLRSERAEVERRPADRPATPADLQQAGERTIEVRESAEVPVVAKEARVIEEVTVGKTIEQRTEEIADTVRNTEVDVQSLQGDATASTSSVYRSHFDANFAQGGGSWDDYEPAYHYGEAARSDPRYRGRGWIEIEPELQSGWESMEPGTWEKFKAAIRHAWERVTA